MISFLNVVEDARIEKLVKRKYPGLSQTFIKGYRDLIANDFFKTKDRNVDDMLLIDRLNMHFKSSYVESDIYFSEPELDIVNRMKNLETFDDVVDAVKEQSLKYQVTSREMPPYGVDPLSSSEINIIAKWADCE